MPFSLTQNGCPKHILDPAHRRFHLVECDIALSIVRTERAEEALIAEYVGSLADTMRRAAREFDTDLPIAGTYIRKAASQVEGVSDQIRNGNLNDLVRTAQSFARRQPTAFLGLAVLAGFGAVRFLKSSSDEAGLASKGAGMTGQSAAADNRGYRNDFSN